MFILKNALISITRNKGRNILIGIIILVIACASTIALAINNTASDLINSYMSAYDKELTISFNRENMMKNVDFSDTTSREEIGKKFNNIEAYTIEDVEKFATSEHVESYYYTYNISLNGNTIEKAESSSNGSKMGGMRGMGFPGGGEMPGSSSYDFTLSGYSSVEAMSEFMEGTYKMSEIADDAWDKAFDDNYVFINEELASFNSLKVGDKFKLEDDDGNTYEFEIVGIFKENSNEDTTSTKPMDLFSSSANTIITNAAALVKITDEHEDIKGTTKPTFIIDAYENADKIQAEFYEKGLNENFVVETNEEAATAGLSSIKNVQSFATAFLVITLIIGGIVLFVINMINIRERKYEIGVLRTIGISKSKLTMQFVSELLIVGFVALLLGAGVGAIASKDVSNTLLASEIESSKNSAEQMKENFGGPGGFNPMSGNRSSSNSNSSSRPSGGPMGGDFAMKGKPNVQAYDSIDAVVNFSVIVELLGIGLALILVSSLASMISIQRFTPLTILKERS